MAHLIVKSEQHGDVRIPLGEAPVFVGRSADKDICLRDLTVSNNHATIVVSGERYVLRDMRSTNGTFVNGLQVEERELRNGDEVRIGNTLMVFRDEGADASGNTPKDDKLTESNFDDLFSNTVSLTLDEIESGVFGPDKGNKGKVTKGEVEALQRKIAVLYELGQTGNRLERLDRFLPKLIKLCAAAVGGERAFLPIDRPRYRRSGPARVQRPVAR